MAFNIFPHPWPEITGLDRGVSSRETKVAAEGISWQDSRTAARRGVGTTRTRLFWAVVRYRVLFWTNKVTYSQRMGDLDNSHVFVLCAVCRS